MTNLESHMKQPRQDSRKLLIRYKEEKFSIGVLTVEVYC